MVRPAVESAETSRGPRVRFCQVAGGVRIAYARLGSGPALMVPAPWISHVELTCQDPAVRAFFEPLAAHRSVVFYDAPGSGLSDPSPRGLSLEAEVDVLRAVADELEFERMALLGMSTGAPIAVAFAADQPDRVDRLVLYGGYADGGQIASPQVRLALTDLIRANWGLGSDLLADIFVADADADDRVNFARLQRAAATAEVADQLLTRCYAYDVTKLLDAITAPTLVLHRRADRAVPYRLGRELAAGIRGAQLITLEGRSHFPYVGDSQAVVRAVLEFLGDPPPAPAPVRSRAMLTARQLEVAAMVAEGLTNRQIAGSLGIEERSAEGHVERIRQRLGFSSRSQIAAWWARGAG